MTRRFKPSRRLGGALGLLGAPILVIGALSLPSASADSTLSALELARLTQANCQVLLAKATTPETTSRAQDCIADQQIIIAALTSTPSPTPSGSPSASPGPSPTRPGNQTNCLARLAECGFPNAANTGVPDGTVLTPVSGNLVITTPGTVVDKKEIKGCVEVRATNVVIRNSRVVGDCFMAIRNFGNALVVLDSEVSCGKINGTGIGSSHVTVVRTEIFDCENGFDVSGSTFVRDSYIHDLEGGGGAHTDGAQFNRGASLIVFQHNTIISPMPGGTSALIAWNEGNPQNANVLITGNLLSGGTYTLYCPRQPSTNFRVTDNRFGEHQYGSSDACVPGNITEFSGNVNDADNTPVNAA